MAKTRSRKTTVKWNMFFSCLAQAQTFILGIVLVPLYLKYIPIEHYGAWLATGNVLLWITLIDPGLNNVIKQKVAFAYGSDLKDISGYANAGIVINIVISVCVALLGVFVAPHLGTILNLGVETSEIIEPAFTIAAFGCALSLFSLGVASVSSGLHASLSQGLILNAGTAAYILTIFVMIFRDMGIFSFAFGLIVRGLVLAVGHIIYLFWRVCSDRIPWQGRLNRLGEMFTLSGFTFFTRVINGLNAHLSLVLVARFVGAEFVAVFDLTRRAPKFFRTFLSSPINIFLPIIAEMFGAKEHDKIRYNLLRLGRFLIWAIGLYIAGFLALNRDFVALWVGVENYAGDVITFLICLNGGIAIMLYALVSTALAIGDIKRSNMLQLIQGLIILPTFYFGVKHFGIYGLLLAPILPQFLIGFVYYLRSIPRATKISRKDLISLFGEVFKVFLCGGLVCVALSQVHSDSWIEFCGLGLVTVAFYILVMCFFSSMFRGEFNNLFVLSVDKLTFLRRNED